MIPWTLCLGFTLVLTLGHIATAPACIRDLNTALECHAACTRYDTSPHHIIQTQDRPVAAQCRTLSRMPQLHVFNFQFWPDRGISPDLPTAERALWSLCYLVGTVESYRMINIHDKYRFVSWRCFRHVLIRQNHKVYRPGSGHVNRNKPKQAHAHHFMIKMFLLVVCNAKRLPISRP